MNAIAAHKNELRKLLEDLSSDRLVSGITFVALVNAYIARLDANCVDIGARISVHRPRKQIKDQQMEQRAALFHRLHAAARKQAPDIRRRLPHEEHFRRLPLLRDNSL
jgi:hypothetical protein